MKVSASIELMWQMASQEAIASEHKEIEPEHFLAALLKFSELPREEIEKMAPGSEAVKELLADLDSVRRDLEDRTIDTTRVRRELRARIGKGNSPYDGGQKHRSQASKNFFDAAAKLADDAGSEVLAARQVLQAILAAPTPAMEQVLRGVGGAKQPKMSRTPLLEKHGIDLNRQAVAGKLTADSSRQIECKAILNALAQRERRNILLVTESDEAARSVIIAMAHALAARDCAAALKPRRIVDVTGTVSPLEKAAIDIPQMEKLFTEASGEKEIVLFVPAIQANPANAYVDLLKNVWARENVQCVCRIDPGAYRLGIENDKDCKRLTRPIWIHGAQQPEVPNEL